MVGAYCTNKKEVIVMMTKQEARQRTCDGCGKEFVLGFCEDCQTPDFPQQDF